MSNCYVYKWTHIPTLNWYVGVRTSKKAHINDGYICSSKIVLKLIKENPNDWQRTIIDTGTADEMLLLEQEILTLFDAVNDPRSYNLHNSNMKWTRTGCSWEGKRSGKNNPNYGKPMSDEQKAKISAAKKGKPRLDLLGKKRPEHSEKMRGRKGKPHTEESKAKLRAAMIGKKSAKHRNLDE